jgi:hypothetical protein
MALCDCLFYRSHKKLNFVQNLAYTCRMLIRKHGIFNILKYIFLMTRAYASMCQPKRSVCWAPCGEEYDGVQRLRRPPILLLGSLPHRRGPRPPGPNLSCYY